MVNIVNLNSFTILRVVVLTQYNIRVQRNFKIDLKEWYKFYLNLRYSSCKTKTLRKEKKGIIQEFYN